MIERTLKESIKVIEKLQTKGKIESYIEYMAFPYFRNLKENSKILFNFPLTVFVGKNGCGKSSTLQALYGAPKGYSLGDFWFSTKIDPIHEADNGGVRHCFYYGYKQNNDVKEVLKTRARRVNDPEYWESSRPKKSYGMIGGRRNKPIDKKVLYMDFRGELSAFDKYFYFGELAKRLKSKKKQDYLRDQSKRLRTVIDSCEEITIRGARQNYNPIELSEDELQCISYILGRKYTRGILVKHKFFWDWGTSVLLRNDFCEYSEAYAGSGEVAVVNLVHRLLAADPHTLVLLDEPEVSLHPGAQKRLLMFLLDQIIHKKHQVVLSTHSPSIVEGLPAEAIKVFRFAQDVKKFEILNECYPSEAFLHLEEVTGDKILLHCEDKLAFTLIDKVLEDMGGRKRGLFQLTFLPGGQSVIKQEYISVYSREDKANKYVIFDGDQNTGVEIPLIENLSQSVVNNIGQMATLIKSFTGREITFNVDGNNNDGGREDQRLELMKKYIKYYRSNVYYLPLMVPEDIIWDEEAVSSLLKTVNGNNDAMGEIVAKQKGKDRMAKAAECIYGEISYIEDLESLLIAKFIKSRNGLYKVIEGMIINILEKENS